jgi:hypothetical protein
MTKICEKKIVNLNTVREHNEGDPVELWFNRAGRIVVRAYNECHNNCTDVDLLDLSEWLRTGGLRCINDVYQVDEAVELGEKISKELNRIEKSERFDVV